MEAFQKHVPHVNEPESPFVATSQVAKTKLKDLWLFFIYFTGKVVQK